MAKSLLDLGEQIKAHLNTAGKTLNNFNPFSDTDPRMAGRQNFWTTQAPRIATNTLNTVGRTIGSQPVFRTQIAPFIKIPQVSIRQAVQPIKPVLPGITNFLEGKTEETFHQIAQNSQKREESFRTLSIKNPTPEQQRMKEAAMADVLSFSPLGMGSIIAKSGKKLFFGGGPYDPQRVVKGSGISLTTSKEVAKHYADKFNLDTMMVGGKGEGAVREFTLDKSAKILTKKDLPAKLLKNTGLELENVVRYARQKGYDAIDFKGISSFKLSMFGNIPESEIRVINPNAIKYIDPESKKRLSELVNYGNDLMARGYTKAQVDKIGLQEYQRIIKENIPPFAHESYQLAKSKNKIPSEVNSRAIEQAEAIEGMQQVQGNGFVKGFNRLFYPIKNQTQDIQDAVRAWDSELKIGKINANKVAQTFKNDLDKNLEWKLVQYSQKPTSAHADKLGLTVKDLEKGMPLITQSRKFNDEIFKKAREAGVDLNYLQDHIYQVFKERPEKIDDIIQAKGLGGKPGFANKRTIESFEKGMEYNLTPKYSTFAQYNALAQEALERAIANQKIADKLAKSGQLLPESQAPAAWQTVTARFFPKASLKFGNGETFVQSYKAPRELADFLNNIFGGQPMSLSSKLLEKTGQISTGTQDIVLAGGVRKVNFFTLAQANKDLNAGLGEILKLHPIKGTKMALEPLANIVRGFIPGASRRFEQAHAQSIKELADNGIPYQGIGGYENFADNVADNLLNRSGAKTRDLWNSYSNNPTFREFMYQRRISLYENFKQGYLSSGKSENEAIKLAVANLRRYDGIVDDIGRNPDLSNGLKTFFLATKYREAVINSLVNVIRGFSTDIKNPDFATSRSLGLGLVTSLVAMNAMQYQLTGKFMKDNPAGREFELVMPDPENENRYFSIPWMFGYTAVPRRIIGTITASAKGDFPEAIKQFSSLASIPISKGGELLSNRDYFGREIIHEGEPLLPQAALFAAKSFTPGPVRETIKYFEDKGRYEKRLAEGKTATPPNIAMSIVRGMELPLKEGKYSSQFYNIEDKHIKGLTGEERKLYDEIYNKEEPQDTASKLRNNIYEAQLLLQNPNIIETRKKIELETARKLGRQADPFYSLTPDQQRVVLLLKTFYPGDETKSAMQSENISWLKPYWTANAAFYDELRAKGISAQDTRDSDEHFQTSPEMRQLLDTYYSLPYGTGQRSAFTRAHPELVTYWEEKREFTNNQRALLGLPLLEDFFGFGTYARKPRKVRIARASRRKIKIASKKPTKTIKITSVKSKKPPKLGGIKVRSLKNLAMRPNTLFGGRYV